MAAKHKEFTIASNFGALSSTIVSNKVVAELPTTARLLVSFAVSLVLKILYSFGLVLRLLLIIFSLTLLLFYGVSVLPFSNDGIRMTLQLGSNFHEMYMPYLNSLQIPMLGKDDINQPLLIGVSFLLSWPLGLLNNYARQCNGKLGFRRDFRHWVDYKGKVTKTMELYADDIKSMISHKKMNVKEIHDLSNYLHELAGAMKQELTFLSMDAVDVDKLTNESRLAAALNFKQENALVQKVLQRYTPLDIAWTTRGMVACFNSADDAVHAAEDIFSAVKRLSAKQKDQQIDYRMYCGIHSGMVVYDGSVALDALCDHVLDIADHFQKFSLQNHVCISNNTYTRLSDQSPFTVAGTEVDGLEMYTAKQ